MKIDLTAAADVVPLNSVDVERGRIAQHIRQADGEIAAGARKRRLNRFKLTKCSKSRNGSSWLTYCSRRAAISSVPMASRHSTNTPPSCSRMQTASLPRLRRTMLWQRLLPRVQGTAGAQQPPAAASPPPPPVAPSSSTPRPRIEEDAVTIPRSNDRGGAAGGGPTAGSSVSG